MNILVVAKLKKRKNCKIIYIIASYTCIAILFQNYFKEGKDMVAFCTTVQKSH